MSGQHTPMAQVSEDAVFFLRKQPDGSRWPVDTQLFAKSPLIDAAPDLYQWAAQTIARAHRGAVFLDVEDVDELKDIVAKATASTTDAGVVG